LLAFGFVLSAFSYIKGVKTYKNKAIFNTHYIFKLDFVDETYLFLTIFGYTYGIFYIGVINGNFR